MHFAGVSYDFWKETQCAALTFDVNGMQKPKFETLSIHILSRIFHIVLY